MESIPKAHNRGRPPYPDVLTPPELRWALFEATKCGTRTTAPDHDYYVALRERLDGKRPVLSMAHKLARRLLPHAARPRRRGLEGTRPAKAGDGLIVVIGSRSRPDQLMFAAGSRQPPVAPTRRGRP